MSTQPQPPSAPARPDIPTPRIEVRDAWPVPHAVAPTLRFALHLDDPSEREVYTIALSAQINLEPAKRRYEPEERDALVDLFGEPERWGTTTSPLVWARVDVLAPSFVGETDFTLDVPCTYDHEVGAAKYFQGLSGGEAPMAFHFSGRVMYRGDGGSLQVVLVPWSVSADFRLPVSVWRRMIDEHYPGLGWARLQHDTIASLRRRAGERGLPSIDAALSELLEEES